MRSGLRFSRATREDDGADQWPSCKEQESDLEVALAPPSGRRGQSWRASLGLSWLVVRHDLAEDVIDLLVAGLGSAVMNAPAVPNLFLISETVMSRPILPGIWGAI